MINNYQYFGLEDYLQIFIFKDWSILVYIIFKDILERMSLLQQTKKVALAALLSFCAAEGYFYELNSKKKQTNLGPDANIDHNNQLPAEGVIVPPFRTIKYPHFSILYSTYHKSPLAVHETITKEIAEGDAPRSRFFFADDHIKQKHFQVDNSYYYETQAFSNFNLNRGHMAAAGNYSGKESQKFHTFSFANVIPQNGTNNGGIWNTLERYSRDLAFGNLCESVEVISGPIYPKNSPFSKQSEQIKTKKSYNSVLKVLKQDGIPIPEKLYKIIQCNSKRGTFIGSYQFLNQDTEDNSKKIREFEVPLSAIEKQTGLKFNLEGSLLSQIDPLSLNKTKKEIDYPFYYGLIANSTKVSDMAEGLRRASSQKIEIQLNDLTEKIKQATKKQFEEIDKDNISSCQKLRKMASVSRKLYHLKHLQQTAQIRDEKMQNLFIECRKTPAELSLVAQDFKQEIERLEKGLASKTKQQ